MKDGNLTIPEHLLSYRRAKSISDHARKPRKSPKKCLSSVLDSVSEDVAIQTPNSSGEISSISDLFKEHPLYDATPSQKICMSSRLDSISEDVSIQTPNSYGEISSISESSILTMDPVISPTSETASNNLTPLSPFTKVDNEGYITPGFNASAESASAEVVVDHLRRVLTQIVSSSNEDPRVKKVLDSLITAVIQEFYGSEERDFFRKLASCRNCIMLLSFVLWILLLAAVLVSTSSSQRSFSEPPPT